MRVNSISIFLSLVIVSIFSGKLYASDLHAGYYYPEGGTQEVYVAVTEKSLEASKATRSAFAVGMDKQQRDRGYPPSFHLFVKGKDHEKMIIIGVQDGRYNTLFRMRALLASLTSMARATQLFAETDNPQNFNFLDFCKLMGFKQVTVSDGDRFTHRYIIE
ncbi:MAG: hypothetical protein ABJN26_11390 [Stappiaceae bacterium]